MKPTFALSLSMDGIRLVHIAADPEVHVGTVPLDSPSLTSDLSDLRDAAQVIEEYEFSTTLIIPNDQIRYLSTDPQGAPEEDFTEIARQTLVGATPYAVDDLAIDYCVDAGVLRIAAVAQDTLQEAETFAIEHGFNPVLFSALPNSTDFIGAPNFGATQHAEDTLIAEPKLTFDPEPSKEVETEKEGTEEVATVSVETITEDLSAPSDPASSADTDASDVVEASDDIDTADAEAESAPTEVSPSANSTSSEPTPTSAIASAPKVQAEQSLLATKSPPTQRRPRNPALIAAGVVGLVVLNLAIWPPLLSNDKEVAERSATNIIDDIAALPDEYTGDTAPLSPTQQSTAEPAVTIEPSELSSDEARARYAATGVWQKAPQPPRTPDITDAEDFYQTSLDPEVPSSDAVALPAVAYLQTDQHPNSESPSPGADVTFEFDDRGLVVATDYGAITPQGVIVYSGRPNASQPPWPKRHIVGQPKEIDEPFAALRPQSRPADLSDSIERNTLNGRTLSELAAFRPKIRPKAVEERAISTISPGANSETINTAVAAAIQSSAPDIAPTKEAVTASVMPKLRPRIVEKAAKSQQTAAVAQPVSKAQKVTPSVPTSASVTRQATEKNAIKLRQINLIGVYGSPSNRRALVRMANGRYKKVTVGDRLDGGKVAAIGKSELRYVKKGRNITLQMPKG
ncbi:hypothetical protein [Roseovarius albus]|nr:hypothetical protein [Roseovarius albus]